MLKNFCKVINDLKVYTTYEEWIHRNFPEYLDIYTYVFGDSPAEDKTYLFLGSAPHGDIHYDSFNITICLILDPEKAQLYMIGDEGLEMVF